MAAKKSTGEDERKGNLSAETAPGEDEALSALENAHQKIAGRAYQLHLDRGAEDGRALEDWLRAEQEVLGEES